MSAHAGCDERVADHTKHDRKSHALQDEIAVSGATSRHYVAGTSTAFTSRSPLSPLQLQRTGRDLWRETLQGQRHARRSNSALSPRHGNRIKSRVRPAKDDHPVRRSLDSQRPDIARRGYGLGVTDGADAAGESPYLVGSVGDGYSRPMWSDEQLRRARRFSSGHTRGASCPTLNITRIMRSISVSAGHGTGVSRLTPRQTRRESGMPGNSPGATAIEFYRQHQKQHCYPADAMTLPVLATINSCSGEESPAARATPCPETLTTDCSSNNNNTIGSNVLDHQPPLCIRTDVRPISTLPLPPAFCLAEGLRRRISVRQREVGTPDFMAQSEAASPLPLEEKEEEEDDDEAIVTTGRSAELHHSHEPGSETHQFAALSSLSPPPSSAPSTRSTCSSARWSTISAESPHKRYSYSSSAIAEALRNLQSVAKGDIFGDSDSNSLGRGSGDESMTITLKAPRKLGDGESEGDDTGDFAHNNRSRGDTLGNSNGESFALSDPPSLRPSSERNKVAIPAVYLDGAASLWDQYVAELESSEFDSNIHLKRQRVSQFMRVPWHVEKLLWFGIAICFDALIYVFSILPA
ncbi:hypothetical protein IWW38_003286, partial [Coemansia aciculifera]